MFKGTIGEISSDPIKEVKWPIHSGTLKTLGNIEEDISV